jgi:hypothetical protein
VLAEGLAKVSILAICGLANTGGLAIRELTLKVRGLAFSGLEKISGCTPLLLSNIVGQISGPAYPATRRAPQYSTWEYLYLLANFKAARYVYRASLKNCLYIDGHISGSVIS